MTKQNQKLDRELWVGKISEEDISPEVQKTILEHLSKKQEWRLGERDHCPAPAMLVNLRRPL